MTDLNDILNKDAILPRVRAASRKIVLSELSAAAARCCPGIDEGVVFDAVMKRERLGSTGVGEGVAIPHARIEGLNKACGVFARLEAPVDFDAIDDEPCDLVFMLLAPMGDGADHLRALARVSRVMRQDALRKALRDAHSIDAIWECFENPPQDAHNAA